MNQGCSSRFLIRIALSFWFGSRCLSPIVSNCLSALFLSYLVHFSPTTILYSYCEGVIFFVSGYFLEMCEHLSPILHNLLWCGKVNRNTNIALKDYPQFKNHNQQKQWASDLITKQSCNNFVMRKRQQEISSRGRGRRVKRGGGLASATREEIEELKR